MLGRLISSIAFFPRPQYTEEELEDYKKVWDLGVIPSSRINNKARQSILQTSLKWVERKDGYKIPAVYINHLTPPKRHNNQKPKKNHPFLREIKKKLTILFSHGNAEDTILLTILFKQMQTMAMELDVNIILYDYCGYGVHTLRKPSEEDVYTDIESVYEYATEKLKIPEETIVVWGRSIGSGPATHIASLHPNRIGGLILQSPLTSAVGVVWNGINQPRFNFLRRKCDVFDNLTKIQSVRRPVFIVHGTSDGVVPARCGQALHENLSPEAKEVVPPLWVEGAGHNDVEATGGWLYDDRLREFLEVCMIPF